MTLHVGSSRLGCRINSLLGPRSCRRAEASHPDYCGVDANRQDRGRSVPAHSPARTLPHSSRDSSPSQSTEKMVMMHERCSRTGFLFSWTTLINRGASGDPCASRIGAVVLPRASSRPSAWEEPTSAPVMAMLIAALCGRRHVRMPARTSAQIDRATSRIRTSAPAGRWGAAHLARPRNRSLWW